MSTITFFLPLLHSVILILKVLSLATSNVPHWQIHCITTAVFIPTYHSGRQAALNPDDHGHLLAAKDVLLDSDVQINVNASPLAYRTVLPTGQWDKSR